MVCNMARSCMAHEFSMSFGHEQSDGSWRLRRATRLATSLLMDQDIFQRKSGCRYASTEYKEPTS
jgi:hypothetical protein